VQKTTVRSEEASVLFSTAALRLAPHAKTLAAGQHQGQVRKRFRLNTAGEKIRSLLAFLSGAAQSRRSKPLAAYGLPRPAIKWFDALKGYGFIEKGPRR
jgi:hypothetical protein